MKVTLLTIMFTLALTVAGFAQQGDPPQVQIQPDVAALQSQLSNAGCNAALNAAANEIIKLRKEVAQLQQSQAKSGATKH